MIDFLDIVNVIFEFNVGRIKKKLSLHKRTQSFKNILQKQILRYISDYVHYIFR